MKIQELFEAYEDPKTTFKPITATPKGKDGTFVISTTATAGATIDAICDIFYFFAKRKDVTMKSKMGKALSTLSYGRPNGFVITFSNPEGAQAVLDDAIEAAVAGTKRDLASKEAHKKAAPERKKEASKFAAAQRKEDLAEYDKLYGKGTWNRVTYRQEGGDDGYQYVVRVDGRVLANGLTQSSAMHEKRKAVNAIAQKEKLGKYAE